MKVAVALSGGIDSAVAAALLRQQGWEVLAVHLRLTDWQPEPPAVQALADYLGLELRLVDLRPAFRTEIIDYFVSSYESGQTPNPCVRCNERIKFGRLWQQVRDWGCTHLATGHYARVGQTVEGSWGLWRGRDRAKDQSYFLHRLPLELLPQLLFPLGELTKEGVRELGENLGLTRWILPRESQELCFVKEKSYREFLAVRQLLRESRPGWIVNRQGERLGQHRGLAWYTVGQRHGLGLCAPEPYYVLELLPDSNQIVVGSKSELQAAGLEAVAVHWLIPSPTTPLEARVCLRYRQRGVLGLIQPQSGDRVQVWFQESPGAVTPGQAAVFYQGERVLGGGWIVGRLEKWKREPKA